MRDHKVIKRKHHSGTNIRAFTGVAIIGIGILFFLKNMGYLGNFKMWHHWPVLLILIGLAHVFAQKEFRQVFKGIVLITIGTVLMLKYHGQISIEWMQLWPIIVVIIGAGIVVQAISGGRTTPSRGGKKATKGAPQIDLHAVLGGGEYVINSKEFKGGRVTAIMGGVELNLTKASIKGNEVEINVFAMWGGISIRVPEDWDVTVSGTPILGGMDNQTQFRDSDILDGSDKKKTKKLLITGVAIMGGMEVKN